MTRSVFLLNPPSLPGAVANREGSAGMGVLGDAANPFVYPPHLLATAAAVLRAARWRVAGLDAVAQGLDADAVLERLPKSDVLVLPVSYGTQAADRAFLNRLRERQPLARVLAIGPALSYAQVDHVFSDLADALLMGEPELALPAAAARLLAGDLPPGRAVNPYTLAAEHYTPDGLLLNLDAVPMPAWEFFHSQQQPYPFLSVLSSRGCPAGCGFCPYVAAQGDTLRSQSPARTADELIHVAQRYHVGHVILRDPVFALERNRVLAICSELRRRESTVTWECESRPEHFDSRLLRAMHAAGCTTVKLGLESADPDVLHGRGPRGRRAARLSYTWPASPPWCRTASSWALSAGCSCWSACPTRRARRCSAPPSSCAPCAPSACTPRRFIGIQASPCRRWPRTTTRSRSSYCTTPCASGPACGGAR